MIFRFILLLLAASQVYWLYRGHRLARGISRIRTRVLVETAVLVLYLLAAAFTSGLIGGRHTPVRLTPGQAFLAGPFEWWLGSSLFAFLLAGILWIVKSIVRLPLKFAPRPEAPALPSPARRQFLEQVSTAVTATPFLLGVYGALYTRLNLETTAPRIRISRLPRAFHGFRIAQLSDIHIGPFMTEAQIRRFVEIANSLKPDMAVLTGDFVTWDGSTEEAVVRALSGLRAPFGVFGSLGNHDAWTRVERSITALFRKAGIRMLRQERVQLASGGERINLVGIDYVPSHLRFEIEGGPLEELPSMVSSDTANILLSHNPDMFDQAAALGIDLTLSGHTHGGQITLEFISPQIAPSRMVTPYVSGRFEKPGGQLYVNRGIGTIGAPVRLGARPEISVIELVRA